MRGKDVGADVAPFGVGITPAYAGKSCAGRCRGHQRQDHPRVCGEKTMMAEALQSIGGSPPRMRGKEQRSPKPQDAGWITPAYAGKRTPPVEPKSLIQDHPRVCGEKNAFAADGKIHTGSPPRMRGKAGARLCATPYNRITPAYAGKRRRAADVAHNEWDHPRVCGEKTHIAWCKCRYTGSPPRMRGKAALRNCGGIVAGITPAYAGKRISGNPTRQQTRDHPRVCGEKTKKIP